MPATPQDANVRLKEWADDPYNFVRDQFDVKPDPWQEEVLRAFPHKQRIALKACKGPGKTALMAWLAWYFLATRPFPKIAATSITADNLADNLWAEMAKWQHNSPYLSRAFQWSRSRIFSKAHPETWFMTARTWNRSAEASQQGNTLAGLHADHILFLLDESGGIPDSVMAAAEAALSSCKEGHIVQAGNPTHLEGPLWRACNGERRLWHVVEITADPDDPKRSTRVSAEWARQQIEKYGRDNPWVLVNVFGRFPPSSLNTLIGPDECREATRRAYRPEDVANAARVLGVDVARFGDDASVIFPRQGLVAHRPQRLRNLDGTQGATLLARQWESFGADAVFIDDTGGWGASWIDNLRRIGRQPVGIGFASAASDPRYDNKRTEMYFQAVEWIKAGGALPPESAEGVPELIAALSQTTYSFRGDRLLLEPKEQVKARLGGSPDEADAFALTFAQPATRAGAHVGGSGRRFAISDYNPLDPDWRRKAREAGHYLVD